MSLGARAAMTAAARWRASRLARRLRAASSWAPRTRSPACGPEATRAGSAPKKAGVSETTRPDAEEKWSETWWPSKRQAQGRSSDGVPKTVT